MSSVRRRVAGSQSIDTAVPFVALATARRTSEATCSARMRLVGRRRQTEQAMLSALVSAFPPRLKPASNPNPPGESRRRMRRLPLSLERARRHAGSDPSVQTLGVKVGHRRRECRFILLRRAPEILKLEYFGTVVEFSLSGDGRGGTDLSLLATEVDESIRMEMVAGWVSVLMAMKAAVDHHIDLRNHDETRAWGTGFVDN